MTKNILSLDGFKGKKSIKESVAKPVEAPVVNEMVDAIDDVYRVSVDVDLPKSLISSFIKKVKESTGKDLRADMGEKRLAERIVQWSMENYLNIENLPIEIVTGSDKGPVQAQAQTQVQVQPQMDEEPQAQVQAQGQPQAQTQAQPVQSQTQSQAQGQPQVQARAQSAQSAAAQIPAQEI
jgi:hypothetical protein